MLPPELRYERFAPGAVLMPYVEHFWRVANDVGPKPRSESWRCGLADGGVISVTLHQKSPGKVAIGVKHDKLESAESVETWREFWKQLLKYFS